ncbi:ankyrin repeat domain-containing protein [Actinomadura sp. HBU206391]|uniref:ankyrin repeat domain-containing protein n=1 Tax=Actinomadura sp. HBU206391 TaxID=2731692 RepID=UPI00164EE2EC|nr:ankyrin repeat domain-containing protein [Actinomadura sp. HBU206391]MBC6461579.1 ankyrin repeat domain-containing protein [Actinomadura sp. HBU206391]
MPSGSVSSTDHLHAEVHARLLRLRGHVPEDFALRHWVASTPAGEYPVPPSVQALLAVTWPEEQSLRRNDEFEWEVGLPAGGEAEAGLVVEDRAWYTVGYDEGQWYLLVDLAEAATTSDPLIYRVDHEGRQPVPRGDRLSEVLSDLKWSTAAIEFGRACAAGDVETVRRALEGGARTGRLDASGITPLHLAAISGSVDIVRALLDAGAEPGAAITADAKFTDFQAIWETYFETYRGVQTDIDPLRCALYPGITPLHTALRNLRVDEVRGSVPEMVTVLLAAGADPHATNSEGWNCADTVYEMKFNERLIDVPQVRECLQILYEAGAELLAYADFPDAED